MNKAWQAQMAGPLTPLVQDVIAADVVQVGMSGARVYRLVDGAGTARFLKVGAQTGVMSVRDEAERLHWLAGRLPVPQVLGYAEDDAHSYLLTTALPGLDAAVLAETDGVDRVQLVRLFAQGLRQIHSVPWHECPLDRRLHVMLEDARQCVEQGLVDEDDFDDERQGRRAGDLFDELVRTAPCTEDLCFTHGDYCLPNIIMAGDQIMGFVDLGRAGVSDRYRDLALARRSLLYNDCGEEMVFLLFQEYGLPQPDEEKLTFYQLLDEFF